MDNLAYIDDTVLKQKTELINGVIYLVSPCPSIDHLSVVGNIYRHFANYLSGKKCVAFPDGADVYLDEQNRFVPDGMIICNREIIKQNGSSRFSRGGIIPHYGTKRPHCEKIRLRQSGRKGILARRYKK